MAEGKGGKILSLTKKRAKRVQEKMMQKLGKSDQTRDDVFGDFVNNFNKQQNVATRLQKELLRYMHSLRMLYQSTKSFREMLGELYEPEWVGYDSYKDIMEQKVLLWEDQLTTLQSKMVEPMTNYNSRFPDVRNRVAKRERKVVDYDLRRRGLEAQRQKAKVNDQKLQHSEESYAHAKQLFDEITDELYDELPTFYDSRIQFYASIFQSIFSTEARFHEEVAKVDLKFAGLMDSLAAEAGTGVHSSKKERSIINTISPKFPSHPGDDSDEESEGEGHLPEDESPPLTTVKEEETPTTTPTASDKLSDSGEASPTTPSRTPTRTPTRTPSTGSDKQKPSKPAPFSGSMKRLPPTKPARSSTTDEEDIMKVANGSVPTSPDEKPDREETAEEPELTKEEEEPPDTTGQEPQTKQEEATTKEGDEAKEPGEAATKEGDEAKEPGEATTKEGDEAKEPGEAATKEGDEAKEPGEAATKEGDEAKEPGEAAMKEGDETKEPGEAATKEGDKAKEPGEDQQQPKVVKSNKETEAEPETPVVVTSPKSPPPKPAPFHLEEEEEQSQPTAGYGEEKAVQEQPRETSSVRSEEGARSSEEPPSVHFKVIAAHPYVGEDEDELSFEKGEVIQVIPYEDPDDEEDGWLMGLSETTGKRGVFPENFTKKME